MRWELKSPARDQVSGGKKRLLGEKAGAGGGGAQQEGKGCSEPQLSQGKCRAVDRRKRGSFLSIMKSKAPWSGKGSGQGGVCHLICPAQVREQDSRGHWISGNHFRALISWGN